MSSRQSANAASGSGFQYAATANYAVAQLNILESVEQGNLVNLGTSNGTGSSAVARELLPILPVSVAVATPSGTFGSTGASVGTSGLTSSSTTATCTLGNPHGYANGATSVTATVVANNPSYNVTAAAATITGPYTFTYTTTGSNLAASGGGTASLQVPAWTTTQSLGTGNSPSVLPAGTTIGATGQPFSSAVVGATIRGSLVSAVEYWADGAVWDTTNSRPLFVGVDFDPAVQWKNS